MKKTIKNRYGLPVVIDYQPHDTSSGLVFIQHGLSGFKEQPHISTLANTFSENGYSVVIFDSTNSFGESGGNIELASLTKHSQDLDDVIDWASNQKWFQSPFVLVGHSLGAASCMLHTLRNPNSVRALAPLSCVLSGEEWVKTYKTHRAEILSEWQKTGFLQRQSQKSPLQSGKLPWSFIEDLHSYDILAEASRIHCPVFLAVGDKDITTTPESQQRLYEALQCPKELHVIPSEHTFETPVALEQLSLAMSKWVKRTLKEKSPIGTYLVPELTLANDRM